jgi:hypothetical protein
MNALLQTEAPGQSPEELIRRDAEAAFALAVAAEHGPQKVGLEQEDYERALKDPRSVTVDIDGVRLPVLIPIKDVEMLDSSGYFDKQEGDHFFLPAYALQDDEVDAVTQVVHSAELPPNSTIVTFFEDSDERAAAYTRKLLDAIPGGVEQRLMVDEKNDTEAGIIHYEGFARIKDRSDMRTDVRTLRQIFLEGVGRGDYIEFPETGTTLLDPVKLKEDTELLDKLWEISDYQFSNLVENLPVRQNPSREEFDQIMTHPETSSIVYFHEGEPVCLTTFLHSVEPAEWLRKEYFDSQLSDDVLLSYFAFMVADAKKPVLKSSHHVLGLLIDLTTRAKSDMNVVFECTNVSATYIPELVQGVVNASETASIAIEESSRYIRLGLTKLAEQNNASRA